MSVTSVFILVCPVLNKANRLPKSVSQILLVGLCVMHCATSAFEISTNSNPVTETLHETGQSQFNLSKIMIGSSDGMLLRNNSSSKYFVQNDSETRNRGMRSEKERLRVALLKQIQSLDHMKCFPKVLCGLSVDSSKNSKDIDSYFVRSYIQLMRSANPDEDSSEETRPMSDSNKDAVSMFLMKSGLLKPKRQSQSASSSEEGSDEPVKTRLEKKNEALKSLLVSKRRLSDDKTSLHAKRDRNPFRLLPLRNLSDEDGTVLRDPLEDKDSQSFVASQIGSLVSSWAPRVSLSFGKDSSFEQDPFFKGSASKLHKKNEQQWQKELDKLVLLMARKNKSKSSRPQGRNFRGLRAMGDEIKVYSTAVDIGKKLKDTKQCDYLYNGCPVAYADIIKIIATIRKDLKQSDDTVESLSKEILEYSQRKKVTKHSQQTNKPTSHSQSTKHIQKPMTKISHTLPNGEKVEINVQLSSKNGDNVDGDTHIEFESPHGDSFVSDDEGLETENISGDVQNPDAIHSVEQFDENDPAISASYELAAEKLQGDHRKPTPLHIFKKLNAKTSSTTTIPPSKLNPKYAVSKKKRPPLPTTATTKKSRPKTTTSPSQSPPTWPTSKKPVTTKRPTRRSTVRPRASSRPSLKKKSNGTDVTTTMKPKTPKPTRVETKTRVTTISTVDIEDSPPTNISKTSLKPASKNGPVKLSENSNHRVPSSNKNKNVSIKRTSTTSSTTTTQRPIYDEEIYFPSKITIEIDKSTQEEVSSEEIITTTTIKPTRTTHKPTPTSTSTSPPLAMLTHSFMDEVIAEMTKTVRPKIRKTTTSAPLPPPKKRRKPIIYNSHHMEKYGQIVSALKKNSTMEESYVSSVESGSGEVHVSTKPHFEGGNQWIKHDENQEQEKIQLDLDDPSSNRDPSKSGPDDPYDAEEPVKKRIIYKNPKRPYLVLMKPGNSSKRKSPQSAISSAANSMNTKDHSSMSVSEAPLVIEPGSSSDYSHWAPE